MDQDEIAVYEKYPRGYYGRDYDPMCHSLTREQHQQEFENQQRQLKNQQMRRSARQSRKPKRDICDGQNQWLALVVNPNTQEISCESSPNFENIKDEILSSAMKKLDRYIIGNGSSETSRKNASVPGLNRSSATAVRAHTSNKRRRTTTDQDVSDSGSPNGSYKQVRSEESDSEGSCIVALRVDATEEWEKWFYNAFRAIQQVGCRVIAKEWIKTIHPKKQSTHPYNGKNPRTGERGDPDSTKPPYWPKDVIHREPDHINKEARTKLLIHLLMNTPHQEISSSGDPKEVTAETLKQALEQKKAEHGMNDLQKKFPIVEQIMEVRATLEQFEAGGLKPDNVIQVTDYSEDVGPNKNEDDSDELVDEQVEGIDHQENPEQVEEAEDFVVISNCKCEPAADEHMSTQLRTIPISDVGAEAGQRTSHQRLRTQLGHHNNSFMQQQTAVPARVPIGHIDPNIHPPMIYGYEDFMTQLAPVPEEMTQIGVPHPMYNLGTSMNTQSTQIEMSNHCHCVVSPSLMLNMNGGAYMDPSFATLPHQTPFTESSHPMHYPEPDGFITDIPEQQAIPFRDNGQHYGPYMMPPGPNPEMMPPTFLPM